MKKLITILIWLITIPLFATKYYCATNGNNGNTGLDTDHPWLTWDYAFDHTPDGDTCYFRGGAYYSTSGVSSGYIIGTYSHPTCFFNYPGERPILDMQNKPYFDGVYAGLYIYLSEYVYLKGLEVRNCPQLASDMWGRGIYFYKCRGYVKMEQCVTHHCTSRGMGTTGCDTSYFINCDSYLNHDTLTTYDPGGGASGMGASTAYYDYTETDAGDSYAYLKGCRAWSCSDNGFPGTGSGTIIWDSCWAIGIGWGWSYDQLSTDGTYGTNGNGWKYDGTDEGADRTPGKIIRIIKNCIATYCEYQGFCENSNNMPQTQIQIYNNFAYNNGFTHKDNKKPTVKYGFVTLYNSDTIGNFNHWYRNNLSYDNGNGDLFVGYNRTENNYWSNPASVTDADFISLDTAGMMGNATRQADGTLPEIQFGHLSSTSNLIDAGTTNTGLPYSGEAPDVGWVEYEETGVGPLVVFTTTVYPHTDWALAGGNVYDDGGGFVDTRGVCWSESENPTIADSHTSDGTGTGVYSSTLIGLLEGTTYHARAYAHNEVGYGYGEDVEFETITAGGGKTVVFHNGKIVFHNGKIIMR